MEKRYATQGTREGERRRERSSDGRRAEDLSPLQEIARYDEQHHYGRRSVEHREREQERRQDHDREEQTRRRMRREGRGRSYGGRRRGPQSRS